MPNHRPGCSACRHRATTKNKSMDKRPSSREGKSDSPGSGAPSAEEGSPGVSKPTSNSGEGSNSSPVPHNGSKSHDVGGGVSSSSPSGSDAQAQATVNAAATSSSPAPSVGDTPPQDMHLDPESSPPPTESKNKPVASNQGDAHQQPESQSNKHVGGGACSPHPHNSDRGSHLHVGHRGRGHANRQRRPSPSHTMNTHQMDEDGTYSSGFQGGLSNPTEKRSRSAHNYHGRNNSGASSNYSNLPLSSSPSLGPSSVQPPSMNHQNAPYNWQSSRTTVKERLQYMYNNEVMADVHFIVGKGPNFQRIPAHKFVLSIGSAVFDAMFNGGMATTQNEIEIPDVEPSAFLSLLRFLYTDEVQIGPETVMTTLYAAKKYAVPALERACVEFLKRNLCSDNAFMLLTQARLFDEPQLAALCLETIDKNTNEALNAEGFTDIDLDTLCVVLERDTLGIRECKLFSAVCRWAGAEAQRQSLSVTSENQRAVLGRSLSLIRFPLMTVEEFAVGAAQSGILTDREVVELFLHFTVNPKPSVKFLDTPRCCLTGKEQVVARFCQIESRWGYSGTSDRIR